MRSNKKLEPDSEGEEPNFPPPQLIKKAVSSYKAPKQFLMTFNNNFKEEIIQVDQTAIECLEFLNQGDNLAIGCSNGATKIISVKQGNTHLILKEKDKSPITGMAQNTNKSQVKQGLMLTHSDGTLQYWNSNSSQLLFSKRYDQMLQTCEISPLGTHYAFGGELGKIRIGHLHKGDPVQVETGHLGSHQNRIFCLKWDNEDNNMLLSGGWDRAIHFWDIRSKTSVNKIFGSYIGGEAIDIKGHEVLLGNNKPLNHLRIFDRKAGKIRCLNWDLTDPAQSHHTTGVLSCFFTGEDEIVACTPKNEIRLFQSEKCISQYKNRQEDLHIYCMTRLQKQRKIVTGWNDGSIRWLTY